MKIHFAATSRNQYSPPVHECRSELIDGEIVFTCTRCNYRRGFNQATEMSWVENPNDWVQHIGSHAGNSIDDYEN